MKLFIDDKIDITMLTDKYVNIFTDFGFKKIFGTEINKDLVIDLLNELIKEQGKITDITYLQNEHLGSSYIDRKAIFDIYCENERGEKFIVELQKAKQNFFKDRSVFYATFPIQEQAKRGEWDFELKAVYTIGILDFVFEENKESTDYFHHEVKLMETKRKQVFYNKLTFIYLEMPKFNKTEDELVTHFDKWMFLIKNMAYLDHRPVKLQERIFEKVFKVAEIAKFSPDDCKAYEGSLKYYRDLKNVIDTGRSEGFAEGLHEGEQLGIQKGRQEGEQIGLQKTYDKLIKSGMTPEQAKQILGI